jgi:hypothetical protein
MLDLILMILNSVFVGLRSHAAIQAEIMVAQLWPLSLTGEDGQLMTKGDVFQGNLLVTTEYEDEESNCQQE